MSHAYELGPAGEGDRFRIALLTAAFSAVLGIGVAYVLLMTQPEFSRAAKSFLGERLFPETAQWVVPVALAGLATGAAGVGIYLLSGFVRGARRKPFLLLAPLLCGLSVTVLAGMPAEPALGTLGSPGFAVPALMLALGGATLFQLPGKAAKLFGAVAWLAPGVLLALGFFSHSVQVSFAALLSPQSHPFSMLLVFTWVSLGLIALLAPDAVDTVPVEDAKAMIGKLRRRLSEAEARAQMVPTGGPGNPALVSTLQARLQQAEEQLRQTAGLYDALSQAQARADRLEADAMAGRSQRPSVPWLMGLCAAGFMLAGIAGYWTVVRPMQTRLSQVVSKANAVALGSAEARAEQDKLALSQRQADAALAAERDKLKAAQAELVAQTATLSELRTKLEGAAAKTEPATVPATVDRSPSPRAGAVKKVREKTVREKTVSKVAAVRGTALPKTQRPSRKAKASAARAAKAAKAPAKAPARADSKPSSDLREDLSGFLSDDPIGGL